MLKFESVNKKYGNNPIISVPSLELDKGVYWLKGGNGAGKSTILKIIAGMIPFEGSIAVKGVDLNKEPVAYRRLVNYVEAEPFYPPFLSGTDLIAFFTSVRKATPSQAAELESLFGVDVFKKNAIHTYSSGMVKKLSLVLAFIGQPELILLDEPLVTIDKETIPVLYKLISDSANRGISFIIASHQPLDDSGLPPVAAMEIRDHQLFVL